ncbi:hypothetical protein FRC01_012198 [Tulasnella sp. 417]|nr:hypothetical protein FRC01_012198 [Tulasnella sp. 417]
MASFTNTQGPITPEPDAGSLDEETETVVGFQEPSSSAGTSTGTIRPATNIRHRIVRPPTICQECKQSRLKGSRRTTCEKCIEKKWDFNSDSGTVTRVNAQSVHSTQIRQQQLLETFAKLLGITEDEVQMIMSASSYPPHPGYAGPTVDVRRAQAILGARSGGESIPQSNLAITGPHALASTSRDPLLPPSIITFCRPPPQIPNPSVDILNAGTIRNQIPAYAVDMATRVFQANSIVVSHHVLAQLRVWHRVLGWEPRAASRGSIPAAPIKPVTAANITLAGTKKADNVVLVTARPSEIEYRDQPRPKDLSVLALAHEVFIMPAISAQQQEEGVVSSHILDSLSALGLSSSDASTSSSNPSLSSGFGVSVSHKFPALSLGSSSASRSSSQPSSSPGHGVPRVASPFSSISLSPSSLPLISPQVVLWYLPTQPWNRAFMDEFDRLMITHDGIGASGEHSILKKRIELMVEWADRSMKRSGSADEEPDPDSGSKCSSPSSPSPTQSQRKGSATRARGAGGTAREELKPLPAPPTVGLFAVACAVYALGALSYGSRSVHGRFPEDSGSTPGATATAPGALLNPHIHPLPDKATPSNLFNLARAALLVYDESALPPSLDYLHAHMLTWLYLLHPSDSASSVASCGFRGASTGVGSGGTTVVEQMIYKELSKCVSVAREMGLDLVDRPNEKLKGGALGAWRVKGPNDGGEVMGVWEKEMRRRVWWQLMMFDQQISDNLGRPPLIPHGTYACNPPSAANESLFGPTATSIPNPPERAIGLNTTYFAAKCQLLAIIKTLPYAHLGDGLTSDLANQLDDRVSNWRSALPAQYDIDFHEKPENTSFPGVDTADVQACDLHIMANVFILRLWLPFFDEALSSSSQSSQGVLLAATNAANAVIVASHHLVKRFQDARPMSFGHYDFGNSVWLAAGILASVVTTKPDVIFTSTARRGLELAGEVFRDQVVEGKSDSDHVPKYEVNNIMSRIERIVAQVRKGKLSSVSHHKSGTDLSEMRCSVPIPYVGTAAITTTTETSVLLAQSNPPPALALGPQRNLPDQETDETSSDSVLLTPSCPEMYLDPLAGSDTSYSWSSSEAEAHRVTPPPNQPTAKNRPPIQQLSPLNTTFRQDPPSQNVQHLHGATNTVDSRPKSPLSQSYGSRASAHPQTAISMAFLQADTKFTNLQTTGGLSESRQHDSRDPGPDGSHFDMQSNIGMLSPRQTLPISLDKPFDTRTSYPSHLQPVIQQQSGSHPKIFRPERETSNSFPEVRRGNFSAL